MNESKRPPASTNAKGPRITSAGSVMNFTPSVYGPKTRKLERSALALVYLLGRDGPQFCDDVTRAVLEITGASKSTVQWAFRSLEGAVYSDNGWWRLI